MSGFSGGGTVRYDISQALTSAQQVQARTNEYAAPFDALAYNGMQTNGSMDVSQELGSLAATALTTAAANKYIIDGWVARFKSSGFVLSAQQVPTTTLACPPGYSNSLQLKATTGGALGATDYAFLGHLIEGVRVARLDFGKSTAQSVTVGFWAYATITGTASLSLLNGASNRKIGAAFTINNATTWEYKTVTILGDTTATGWSYDTTLGLQVNFNFGEGASDAGLSSWTGSGSFSGGLVTTNFFASTNNVVHITGVVVLPGIEVPSSDRSPFIMRPFDQEYVLAQRYWEKSYGYNVALGTVSERLGARISAATATSQIGGCTFVAPKRIIPAVTLYSYNGTSGKWSVASTDADTAAAAPADIGLNGWFRSASSGLTVGVLYYGHFAADSRL